MLLCWISPSLDHFQDKQVELVDEPGIGPGETGDFGNFYFPQRPQNYGWDYKILNVETPSGG